jgi:cholinesterase
VPVLSWAPEVYDATTQKSGCFEYNGMLKKIAGSDDCLYLNIYTKTLKPLKPQPIMVYIHGGAFQSVMTL